MDSDRVRAQLARLGDDVASAPDVPRPVTERVVAALRAAPPVRRALAVRVSATVGVAAALTAAGIGTVMLLRAGSSVPPTASSAKHLTTEPPAPTVPLSDDEIIGLLDRTPDLGALGDARRRSSCLSGLGYPGRDVVLGGQQVDVNGEPAVLLVLPGDTPESVVALAVRPNCSSADTGLLADTQIRRP
ncbi:MAG TPA: hypothetical protein VLU24_01115 [Mycobacterium sp.]|nr:hypothetical protein [Mycobacterium sp.]